MSVLQQHKSTHGSIVGQTQKAEAWSEGADVHYIPFLVARKKIVAMGEQMEKQKKDHIGVIKRLKEHHDITIQKVRKEDSFRIEAVKEGARKKITELTAKLKQQAVELDKIREAEGELRRQQLREAEAVRKNVVRLKDAEIKKITEDFIQEMKDMNVRAEKNEVEIRKELNTMMTNQREKAKGIINALNEKLAKQKENYEKLAQEKESAHKRFVESQQKSSDEKCKQIEERYMEATAKSREEFEQKIDLKKKEYEQKLESKKQEIEAKEKELKEKDIQLAQREEEHKKELKDKIQEKNKEMEAAIKQKVDYYEKSIKGRQARQMTIVENAQEEAAQEKEKFRNETEAEFKRARAALTEKYEKMEMDLKERITKLEVELATERTRGENAKAAQSQNPDDDEVAVIPEKWMKEREELMFKAKMLENQLDQERNRERDYKRSPHDQKLFQDQAKRIVDASESLARQTKTITMKTEQISEKQKEIEELDQQLRIEKVKSQSLESKISSIERKLGEKDEEILAVRKSKEEAENKTKDLQTQLQVATDEKENAIKRMEDIQKVMDAAQGIPEEVSKAQEQVRALERQREELLAKLESQNEELIKERKLSEETQKVLASQRDKFKEEFNNKKKEWTEMKKKAQEMENNMKDSQESNAPDELAELKKKIKAQEKEMLSLKNNHKKVRDKLKKTKEKEAEAKEKATLAKRDAEEQRRTMNKMLMETKRTIASTERGKGDGKEKLASLLLAEKDKVRKLEHEQKKIERQGKEQISIITSLRKEVKKIGNEAANLEKEVQLKEKEILELKAKIDPQEVQKLKTKLEEQEGEAKRAQEELAEAQTQMARAQAETAALNGELTKFKGESADLKESLSKAESQLVQASRLAKDGLYSEGEIKVLQEKIVSLEAKLGSDISGASVEETQKLNARIQALAKEIKSKEIYITQLLEDVKNAGGTASSAPAPVAKVTDDDHDAELKALKNTAQRLQGALEKAAEENAKNNSKSANAIRKLKLQIRDLQHELEQTKKLNGRATAPGSEEAQTLQKQEGESGAQLAQRKYSDSEEVNSLKAEVKNLSRELEVAKKSVKSGATTSNELIPNSEGQSAKLEAVAKDSKALFDSKLKAMAEEFEVKIKDMAAEHEGKVKTMDEEFQVKMRELKEKLAEASKDTDVITKEKEEVKNRLTKTEGVLATRTEEKQQLEKDFAAFREQSKATFARCEQLENQAKELNGTIDKHLETIEEWKKTAKDWEDLYNHNSKAVLEEAQMRKKLQLELMNYKGNIRVFCRIRPFSKKEKKDKAEGCIRTGINDWTLQLNDPKKDLSGKTRDEWKDYSFDHVFPGFPPEKGNQSAVFEETRIYAEVAMGGKNACVFAYGQSGTGKTWTMSGIKDDPINEGIKPRMFRELFKVQDAQKAVFEYSFEVQMIEIYGQKKKQQLRDLFYLMEQNKKLKKKQSNKAPTKWPDYNGPDLKISISGNKKKKVAILGAEKRKFSTYQDMIKICTDAEKCRFVRATGLNDESSRSHLITIVHVKSVNKKTKKAVNGKLTLVDLAGSEKAEKTEMAEDLDKKQRQAMLDEGVSINQSLGMLRKLFLVLSGSDKKAKAQYRGNYLTELLQDSIGGGAKTLMFVNIGPAARNRSESMDSMRYAEYAKNVVNEIEGEDADLAAQNKELERRVAQLEAQLGGG